MEINELKIGNLVDYELTTHIICGLDEITNRVSSWWLKDKGPFIEKEPYVDIIDNYSPIELTVEILLKFGFELYSTQTEKTIWDNDTTETLIYSYNDEFPVSYSKGAGCEFKCRNYCVTNFHSIQNIYFMNFKRNMNFNVSQK